MENKSYNENYNKIENLSEEKPHKLNNISKNKEINESQKFINRDEEIKKLYPYNNNYIYKKKGNSYIISVDKEGNIIYTIGSEWIFFGMLNIFIASAFLIFFYFYYQFMPLYIVLSGLLIYIFFFFIYTRLFITNPGFPRKINKDSINNDKNNYLYCSLCDNWVDKKAKVKHCSKCGLCIEKQDHHCDWIGKCVGKNNLCKFYCFIACIIVMIVYFVVAFIISHNNWFAYKKYMRKMEKMKNNNK